MLPVPCTGVHRICEHCATHGTGARQDPRVFLDRERWHGACSTFLLALKLAGAHANASGAESPGPRDGAPITDCRRMRAAHATRTVKRDPDATFRAACSCLKRDRGGRGIRAVCVWPGVFAAW